MAGKEYSELLDAIRAVNRIQDLGDSIYEVREREGLGWEGPLVTEYNKSVEIIKKHLGGKS